LIWSTSYHQEGRTKDGNQASQAGRNRRQAAPGRSVGWTGHGRIDAIRRISITEQTYCRWRMQYGGMGTAQLKELKCLQKENERLRKAVSDLTVDKLTLAEAAS
jgi:hypothetical protein